MRRLFIVPSIAVALLAFTQPAISAEAKKPNESTLLTILLRHDQTKTLDEIQANLAKNHFYETFPPAGTSIVYWHVVMGVGQILTIKSPHAMINSVQKTLKKSTVGAFTTEVYPTEDHYPAIEALLKNKSKESLGDKPTPPGNQIMTVMLKPNSQSLEDASRIAASQHLYERFPPKGASIISWNSATGLGEVIVLHFPAEILREVNLPLEQSAWKAYSTEFFPTYDFYPIAKKTFKLKNTAQESP